MATPEPLTTEQLRKGFLLGEWRVWPNAGQIESKGFKHHIEPKLVEVLLFLAQHAGQVVSREALLDHAWQRQVVCDEALTRTISELRTLLGDTGRERLYIRTVPKRGYSLIADVQLINTAATSISRNTITPMSWANGESGTVSLANRLIKYWLYGVGSLSTVVAAMLVLVIIVVDDVYLDVTHDDNWAAMTTPAKGDEGIGDLLQTSSLPNIKRYAVLPFINLTPEQDLTSFTLGLEEDIRTSLATLDGAQVAGRVATDQFQLDSLENPAASIQNIANHLNVDAIFDGTVRLIDGRIRVTIQLLDATTGFPLWSKRYDKEFQQVLTLQTAISDDITCELESRLPKTKFVAGIYLKPNRSKEEALSLPIEEYGHTRHVEWLAR